MGVFEKSKELFENKKNIQKIPKYAKNLIYVLQSNVGLKVWFFKYL